MRIATIAGHREPLRSSYEPELRPLIVTTLGRTGSTWLIHLLGTHPGVTAYRPFSFEPRAATYWTDILASLSEPVLLHAAGRGRRAATRCRGGWDRARG